MKAIVDCNSFYCSCERLFRPDLWNKPVVVLSNNDGCIISRSDEAKELGIGMAWPYFQVQHIMRKHEVAVFSSNYNLYGDMSWRVMQTLRNLSASVEVYSVDEAFMDLGDIPVDQIPHYAMHIRKTVEQHTGISVSVGVAPTKTLAKVANHIAKKNKKQTECVTCLISDDEIRKALTSTRVGELWGVGRSYADKLVNLGITGAWELRNMPEEWAYKNLGGVVGTRLMRELRGEACITMNDPLETKKMILTTRMFGHEVTDVTSIREAVATYTSRAAEKLRRQHSAASMISVFVVKKQDSHEANFKHGTTLSDYRVLPLATSLTHELIKPAVELADGLYKNGETYKKAGVMLSGLVPDESIQGNLFHAQSKNSGRLLMDMIDNVNFSMRNDVLKFASSGTTKNWKMRQELRSGRYGTRWEELREVR